MEQKLIMVGNVNRGGVDNLDIPTTNKDYLPLLQPELMDIV